MLTGTSLRDYAGLPHPSGQQGLADDIVDLVRAGVVQIFALEHNDRKLSSRGTHGVLTEPLRFGDRARPPRVVGQQLTELGLEGRICHS